MEISIVSSHYSENLSWLYSSPYPVFVISKEGGAALNEKNFFKLHKIRNRGSEFGSYLWFICNYWDSLPDRVAFIHGHETSSHQCIPIFNAIDLFKHKDFHGLNGPRTVAYHYFFEDVPNLWFSNPLNVWNHIGLNNFFCMPRQFVFQGATQTIISKDFIKFYPKQFYENILNKIMCASKQEAWYIGLFLEIVWHCLFHQNPINFDLIDMEINDYCIRKKVTIALLGKDRVWSSKFHSFVMFGECNDYFDWAKHTRSILFSDQLWNKDVVL